MRSKVHEAAGNGEGLIINGRAPSNQGVTFGEGDTGAFGGNNPADSSGRSQICSCRIRGH